MNLGYRMIFPQSEFIIDVLSVFVHAQDFTYVIALLPASNRLKIPRSVPNYQKSVLTPQQNANKIELRDDQYE